MNTKYFLRAVIAILSLASAVPARAQCTGDRWYPLVPTSAVGSANGSLYAMLTVGPPGSQITYAGGAFTEIGGVAANRIAAWDGTAWHAMGAGFDGGAVLAIAEFDDGSGKAIYAAGQMQTSAGTTVNNIAKWDGTAWRPLGAGVGDYQYNGIAALQVFDDGTGPALYVAGAFGVAGGQPATCIARWDGLLWSSLGLGISNTGYAMAVFDDGKGPSLFVGGVFGQAGGLYARNIARWDGTNWAPVGSVAAGFGVSSEVWAMTVHDDGSGPALFVGGRFAFAGNVAGSSCASWNGTSWRAVGLPAPIFQPGIGCLASVDTGSGRTLCAGGPFRATGVDGRLLQGVAQWDGTKWAPMGSGIAVTGISAWASGVTCISSRTPSSEQPLLVGGSFGTVDGGAATNIAAWSFSEASWLVGGRPLASVLAIAEDPDAPGGAVVVGGAFTTIGSATVNRIARWDGAAWSGMGAGFNGRVQALHRSVFGGVPSFFAGGTFTRSGNDPIGGIGRWDGSAWRPLGSGVNGTVLAIESDGTTGAGLVAAGQFTSAGGQPVRNIARWDGAAWQPLGSGLDGSVYALAYFGEGTDRALYAGGSFTTAGGVPARGIARWDGSTWSAVGQGISGSIATVYALRDVSAADGQRLAVGGSFTRAADINSPNVAAWNGTEWLALGTGLDNAVFSLESQPLHSTRTIYAGGAFSSRIARFEGSAWTSLGTLGDAVQALRLATVAGTASLFVGGSFQTSPTGDPFFTSWRRCAPCDADLNGDSTVDGADLGLLLGSWGACDNCSADVNNDGAVDGADLGLMLGDWGPCPD